MTILFIFRADVKLPLNGYVFWQTLFFCQCVKGAFVHLQSLAKVKIFKIHIINCGYPLPTSSGGYANLWLCFWVFKRTYSCFRFSYLSTFLTFLTSSTTTQLLSQSSAQFPYYSEPLSNITVGCLSQGQEERTHTLED